MCGADGCFLWWWYRFLGSPPHVRGGLLGFRDYRRIYWFTPACAGRMRYHDRSRKPDGVHPRMCGADGRPLKPQDHWVGSPPHVRGGCENLPIRLRQVRFTPACAGRIQSF